MQDRAYKHACGPYRSSVGETCRPSASPSLHHSITHSISNYTQPLPPLQRSHRTCSSLHDRSVVAIGRPSWCITLPSPTQDAQQHPYTLL
ncbi:hypothetical protein BC939DRAFT_433632 [Gamsiella multidivaricata]|uniref:uncharacterized protein n=1 Tax=Gamsiella multidivaricata TaxID=101098 RepID=UPI00221E93D9|nr:uncharacterized protein BC939DRAFT_433632 [Gamsiella multidivaricata]KAI7832516.1 hypothetical protein BC939DRAFT_433632 [Gamsiella multidivaricata]